VLLLETEPSKTVAYIHNTFSLSLSCRRSLSISHTLSNGYISLCSHEPKTASDHHHHHHHHHRTRNVCKPRNMQLAGFRNAQQHTPQPTTTLCRDGVRKSHQLVGPSDPRRRQFQISQRSMSPPNAFAYYQPGAPRKETQRPNRKTILHEIHFNSKIHLQIQRSAAAWVLDWGFVSTATVAYSRLTPLQRPHHRFYPPATNHVVYHKREWLLYRGTTSTYRPPHTNKYNPKATQPH